MAIWLKVFADRLENLGIEPGDPGLQVVVHPLHHGSRNHS